MGHGSVIEGVPVSPGMMMTKDVAGYLVRTEEVRVSRADKHNQSGYLVAGESKC